jgi:hypothetical protein
MLTDSPRRPASPGTTGVDRSRSRRCRSRRGGARWGLSPRAEGIPISGREPRTTALPIRAASVRTRTCELPLAAAPVEGGGPCRTTARVWSSALPLRRSRLKEAAPLVRPWRRQRCAGDESASYALLQALVQAAGSGRSSCGLERFYLGPFERRPRSDRVDLYAMTSIRCAAGPLVQWVTMRFSDPNRPETTGIHGYLTHWGAAENPCRRRLSSQSPDVD